MNNLTIFETPLADITAVANDLRSNKKLALKLITATDERADEGCFKIWYVWGAPAEQTFTVTFIRLANAEEFPALAPFMHEAWEYEKRIKTFFGLTPLGHPDTRPLILHENWPESVYPLRKDFAWDKQPKAATGAYQFQTVGGAGIYEIPVGPIHAGIIEPGHFRFSVAGEEIVLLEPKLGYTHKGSEKLFETLALNDTVRLAEKISGDSSFSHSLAFCQALEQLSGAAVPKRAQYLRVIFAELERLANHFGDIGAIMLDTGFNFGGAHGARLREMVIRINERLTASRFLRGVNIPGGVTKDITDEDSKILSQELTLLQKDFFEVIQVARNRVSLYNRLKDTGILTAKIAADHGATGVAAKALGITNDARADFPYAAYGDLNFNKVETEASGDVYARFRVRIKEAHASLALIQKALTDLPNGAISDKENSLVFKKDAAVVSVVEGWRGEILYFIKTDKHGKIIRVAPRDPSFINWPMLGEAGLGNVVPDFPLINKSFNLSYTGNDL